MLAFDLHAIIYELPAGTLIRLAINNHKAFVAHTHQAERRARRVGNHCRSSMPKTTGEHRRSNGLACRHIKLHPVYGDRYYLCRIFIESLKHELQSYLLQYILMLKDHALLQIKSMAATCPDCPVVHRQADGDINISQSNGIEVDTFFI